MHNQLLQLARPSHWHIVINVLPVGGISQSNLGVGRVEEGGGCRSDPGIIVGDSGPSLSAAAAAAGWDWAQVSGGR